MKNLRRKVTLLILAFAAIFVLPVAASAQSIPGGSVESLQFRAQSGTFTQTIYFSDADELWYSYVPESTGYYGFSVENAELAVYDAGGNMLDGWQGFFLEQDKTYYFCFTKWETSYGVATVTIAPEVDFGYDGSLGLAKETSLSLVLYNQVWVRNITWSSSDPSVVSVDAQGVATALADGSAMITASGTTLAGESFTAYVTIQVTDPALNRDELSMNLYTGTKLTWGSAEGFYQCEDYIVLVQGVTAGNEISVRVLNADGKETKKVYVEQGGFDYYSGAYELRIYPKSVGDYTVEVGVAGKTLTCRLHVYKMYFKRNSKTVADGKSKQWRQYYSMLAMYPKETTVLTVKGASGKIKWTSSDKSVAKVDSKGKITAKNYGYATITATSGDAAITYLVGVSDKTAITALRKCYSMYGKTEYSQPKRMSAGYADCSSFVWKGYKAAGKYLGSSSYALTAAGLSNWCKSKGYRIFYGEADISSLLPGDLIFWCGADNGRTDGIYHVDLYQGNYTTLTVEREKWLWGTLTNVIIARPCIHTTSGVTVKNAGGQKLSVSWKKLYGVTGYEVCQSTSPNGDYKKVATVKGDSATSWTSGKLTKGKTYYYKIRPYWRANKKTFRAGYTSQAHVKVKK
ncbi:MAG: Ig-like domain-containing protein [Blautia sp.]|nr:Ig-like domain-containing protein [Blautia sp.]